MSTRVKTVVVGAFVLALGAGTLMGVGMARMTTATPTGQKSQLATELNLSTEQQAQMEAIWQKAMQAGGPSFTDRRKSIQEERDAELADLLPPAMLQGYDRIMAAYRVKMDALNAEREKSFTEAEERTKEILSPDQRVKYEELMARRQEVHRDHRGPGGAPGTGDGISPATAPAKGS